MWRNLTIYFRETFGDFVFHIWRLLEIISRKCEVPAGWSQPQNGARMQPNAMPMQQRGGAQRESDDSFQVRRAAGAADGTQKHVRKITRDVIFKIFTVSRVVVFFAPKDILGIIRPLRR